MAKQYQRRCTTGVIVNTTKRGKPVSTPKVCIERWCKLTRPATHAAERLAEKACKAAVRVMREARAPTRQELVDAGQLLLRGRNCGMVLLSHILHREGHGAYDAGDSFYNMAVPWCAKHTPFRDVMRCTSVHSCFHVARAGGLLKVDPLTREVHKLVAHMGKLHYPRHEQLKAAALVAYTTSTDVAGDFTKAFASGADLAVAIRQRSARLATLGYKCFLGPMRQGQPHRNRHQGALNGEGMMSLLLRLDRYVTDGKINCFDLEDCVNSDLMFPHVCDVLMGLDFVTLDGPVDTVSSTNVALLHQIYRALGDAPASRKAWLQNVSAELLEILDDVVPSNPAHARFVQELRTKVNAMSVAWNLCKLGVVINVALGGAAKLRQHQTNPIAVAKKILAKIP